jgi:hypothetical protein
VRCVPKAYAGRVGGYHLARGAAVHAPDVPATAWKKTQISLRTWVRWGVSSSSPRSRNSYNLGSGNKSNNSPLSRTLNRLPTQDTGSAGADIQEALSSKITGRWIRSTSGSDYFRPWCDFKADVTPLLSKRLSQKPQDSFTGPALTQQGSPVISRVRHSRLGIPRKPQLRG